MMPNLEDLLLPLNELESLPESIAGTARKGTIWMARSRQGYGMVRFDYGIV